MASWSKPDADLEIEALLADIDRLEGSACASCGSRLCGHQCVIAVQMGLKDAALCVRCLAASLELEPTAFLERALAFLLRRDCYRTAWHRASVNEAQADLQRPACLWGRGPVELDVRSSPAPEAAPPAGEEHWDLGDEGCGDLALALRRRVSALEPGTILQVRATDPGAQHDIPAWCRLAGHALLEASHPTYRIQKKS